MVLQNYFPRLIKSYRTLYNYSSSMNCQRLADKPASSYTRVEFSSERWLRNHSHFSVQWSDEATLFHPLSGAFPLLSNWWLRHRTSLLRLLPGMRLENTLLDLQWQESEERPFQGHGQCLEAGRGTSQLSNIRCWDYWSSPSCSICVMFSDGGQLLYQDETNRLHFPTRFPTVLRSKVA